MAYLDTEYAIRKRLLDSTGLAALVVARIYPEGNVPANAVTPFITIGRRGGDHQQHIAGRNNYVLRNVQINVYDDTVLRLTNIGELIRIALDRYAGEVSITSGATTYKVTIDHLHLENESQSFEREGEGGETILANLSMDFSVGHSLPST